MELSEIALMAIFACCAVKAYISGHCAKESGIDYRFVSMDTYQQQKIENKLDQNIR